MMHTIKINAQGAERKRLVKTISEWLGEDPHYCGAPSFAYEIGRFTVEKEGSLTFSEFVDEEVAERLLHQASAPRVRTGSAALWSGLLQITQTRSAASS